MANININESKVFIRSEIYSPGRDEFGTQEEAECFVVIVERLDGHRLQHNAIFYGVKSGQSEDGFPLYTDVREQAKKAAETLIWNINNHGTINDEHWVEVEPRYGSEYYQVKYF